MVPDDVLHIESIFAARTLVPSVNTLFNALVAETVAARRNGRLIHGGHAYWTLEMLVHGRYLPCRRHAGGFI